ncbi:hypothetical protein [Vibrio splendidus]|uniref:hypothetical protein n=1 Tax=Vibrio splendidus TaxID=29497 RepID=UPI0002D3F886|nr:hypothetical protein [Vibrio splendidus]OED83391.1 hypothetical protein A144_16485 [Vibrio splendidus ZF-90]
MNSGKPNNYAKFLALLAKKAETLSESDIENVLQGNSNLKITVLSCKVKSNKPLQQLAEVDVDRIIHILSTTEDRTVALDSLQTLNKKGLELVAKNLDIAMQRSAKVDEIRSKIIEATVGAKLRSSAIQGTSSINKA